MAKENQTPCTSLEELYNEVVRLTRASEGASCTAWMQKLNIKYATAVRLLDLLEERGIVQPLLLDDDGNAKHESGPRKLMTPEFHTFLKKYEIERAARIKEKQKEAEVERQRQLALRQVARPAASVPTAPTKAVKRGR